MNFDIRAESALQFVPLAQTKNATEEVPFRSKVLNIVKVLAQKMQLTWHKLAVFCENEENNYE